MYLQHSGGLKNDLEAFRLSKIGVKKKHPLSFNNLGMCYQFGKGVPQDIVSAIKWYRKGIALGNSDALNMLAYCYHQGIGMKKNIKEAIRLYCLAANQNVSLIIKSNLKKDFKKATHLSQTRRGNATALHQLAFIYQTGLSVEKNLKEAIRLYKLAVEQGHSAAQSNLGYCYLQGQGIEKDLKEGIRLLRLSAEQRTSGAQYNLGLCYENGRGVPRDINEARYLYQLAALEGDTMSKKKLESI